MGALKRRFDSVVVRIVIPGVLRGHSLPSYTITVVAESV